MEDTSSLREAIISTREGKEFAKSAGVEMGGRPGIRLEGIIDNANFIVAGLENDHEHFLDETYRTIENYVQVPYEELKDAHSIGFNLFLRQQYRTYKKHDPSKLKLLEENDYVKNLAVGYTFDYLRTITLGKKIGIAGDKAMELASVSHWNNPNVLLHLAREFPDADAGLIFEAATDYPSRPEEYIRQSLGLIEELQGKFPDTKISLIKYAATGHAQNAAEFIEEVERNVPLLQVKFPHLEPTIIFYAASHNSRNPDAFLEKFGAKLAKLERKYSRKNLVKAAINKDPEEFLRNIEFDLETQE